MTIQKAVVIGAGFMGSGIAQVTAQAGFDVCLIDTAEELCRKGHAGIAANLEKAVAKEKITAADRDGTLSRIRTGTNLADAADADIVIEAVFENAELKQDIFAQLDGICRETTLFASNTSSIPISLLASATRLPGRFLGRHFFSPAQVMQLVEIIRGLKTSPEAVETARDFVARIGKEGVLVKDVPGFLVNRLNYALRCEAYNLLKEGVATIEDIDKATKLGLRHPMGPFELADFVGLDINLNGLGTLYNGYGDTKWKPYTVLEQLVKNGDLGRKTGKGWYDYTSGEKKKRDDINL